MENVECCHKCQGTGSLLRCDTCTNLFHPNCVEPPPEEILQGEWNCPDCTKPKFDRRAEKILGTFLPEELKNENPSHASDYRYIDIEIGPEHEEAIDENVIFDNTDEAESNSEERDEDSPDEESSIRADGYDTAISSDDSGIIVEDMTSLELVRKFNRIYEISVFDPATKLYNEFIRGCYRMYSAVHREGFKPIYCMFSIESRNHKWLILTVFENRRYEPRHVAQLVPLNEIASLNVRLLLDMERRLKEDRLGDFIRNKAREADYIFNQRKQQLSQRLLIHIGCRLRERLLQMENAKNNNNDDDDIQIIE